MGWKLVGVSYWLLLGILVGSLNLVPYVAMVGLPVVLALNWADQAASGKPVQLVATFVLPIAVQLVGQFLDGWVVEPFVQGRAARMPAVILMLSVLTGGAAFGLPGVVLAVPLVSCLKALAERIVLPRIRTWASGSRRTGSAALAPHPSDP